MERDLTPREDRSTPPDDADIGALVRAVAEDWQRPPQRLDQATWRERVDVSRRGSRGSGGRRWLGRLAEAGVLAVVATLVLALGAVVLTGPGRNGSIGSNPSTAPSDGTSPTAPATRVPTPPVASPLPALLVNGELPSVTSVLLQGGGGYRLADLASGTLGPDLAWNMGWNTPLARPGGGWVCVCGAYPQGSGGPGIEKVVITVEAVDAGGASVGSRDVRTLQSGIEAGEPVTSDIQSVDVLVSASPDGYYAFIGWSERSTTGWHAGVDVVDLASLEVVDRLALPDVARPAEAASRAWVRLAPTVDMAAGVDLALISENWFVDDPTTATPPSGTDRWSATFRAGAMRDPVEAGTRSDGTCFEWEQGVIDAGSFFVACIKNDNGVVRVERFTLAGAPIDNAEVGRFSGFGAFAVRPDHRFFLWDPQTHTLMSYDLQTGATSSLKVPDTAGINGPLDVAAAIGRAIGSWLAPSATAKILLQPAMAVSPDGTRLFAIGINATPSELGGSAGVFAFDISGSELALAGHWPPNADFVSLAVSQDGAFVYAAGMGGVDAEGIDAPGVKSSVTVFDATDGSIRLIAGQLSEHDVIFVEPVVR
jgi:hypothetical protein